MKANRASSGKILAQSLMGGVALVLLASCAPPVERPAPLPPPPVVLPSRPVITPVSKRLSDWRDAPITSGEWRWSVEISTLGSASVARFGIDPSAPMVTLRCDRGSRQVSLVLAGQGSGPVTVSFTTSSVTRPLMGEAAEGRIVVAVSPNDSLLDAIALSRGRFAIEAEGRTALYLPSWPELSRVVEDCRPG